MMTSRLFVMHILGFSMRNDEISLEGEDEGKGKENEESRFSWARVSLHVKTNTSPNSLHKTIILSSTRIAQLVTRLVGGRPFVMIRMTTVTLKACRLVFHNSCVLFIGFVMWLQC